MGNKKQDAWERLQAMVDEKTKKTGVHGMAQTWGNLGLVYADKGEWEQAIEMCQRCLEIEKRLGDVHGLASTWNNLAGVYLQTDRVDEAMPLFAQAFLTLSRLGSPEAQKAANGLVEACGSEDEANAYLVSFVRGSASK
jgi:tetratricopeptide (TPR) repeat protein